MHIDECNIVRRSTILVGFNGEHKNTIGEIVLPVYAEGINLNTRFLILDCLSSYNIIMGRPWIYEMRVVPLTYHQNTLKTKSSNL
ncbi:hypothetical protein ACOSQ3_019643 [Xanthoceras sorbifolium]